MRTLTDHITPTNALNEALTITVLDEPGQGGACHRYMVTLPDWTRNPDGSSPHHVWDIAFQNGPIKEAGLNGLSQESLLAIVIDRLKGFQSGQFACDDNAKALILLEDALGYLHKRTKERVARGVEGDERSLNVASPFNLFASTVAYTGALPDVDTRALGYTLTGTPEEMLLKAAVNVAFLLAKTESPDATPEEWGRRAEELIKRLN